MIWMFLIILSLMSTAIFVNYIDNVARHYGIVLHNLNDLEMQTFAKQIFYLSSPMERVLLLICVLVATPVMLIIGAATELSQLFRDGTHGGKN